VRRTDSEEEETCHSAVNTAVMLDASPYGKASQRLRTFVRKKIKPINIIARLSQEKAFREMTTFKRAVKKHQLHRTLMHIPVEKVRVRCREQQFEVKLLEAKQTFQWLGAASTVRYARLTRRREHYDKPVCVDVLDEYGESLHPQSRIRDKITVGTQVTVVLGRSGLDEKKTSWQLLAETPLSQYMKVKIVYDGPMPEDGEPVHLLSNHSEYTSIPMRAHKNEISTTILVPPGWELNFFFEVSQGKRLSRRYEKDKRKVKYGVKFEQNIKQCNPPKFPEEPDLLSKLQKRDWKMERGSDWDKNNAMDTEDSDIVPKIKRQPWEFRLPGDIRDDHTDCKNLCRELQLNDVVPSLGDRRMVYSVLEDHWSSLNGIFKHYSTFRLPILFMGRIDFINLIGRQKIYNKWFKASASEEVFDRVNIEEDYGEDDHEKLVDKPNSADKGKDLEDEMEEDEETKKKGKEEEGCPTGGFHIVDDEDNPDNLFVRSEFFEALTRVSLRKFPNLSPGVALTEFLTKYLLANEKHCLEKEALFQNIMKKPETKAAFIPFLPKLYKRVFVKISGLDHLEAGSGSSTINWTEFISFLKHKNLVGSGTNVGAAPLSLREAFKAFGHSVELNSRCMTWEGFLEVIVRLAVAIFNSGMDENRMSAAITRMCKEVISLNTVGIRLVS